MNRHLTVNQVAMARILRNHYPDRKNEWQVNWHSIRNAIADHFHGRHMYFDFNLFMKLTMPEGDENE